MKTKIKIIIIAITIISTVILIGLTNSRYFTQVELVGDFEVATAIIDIEEQKEEIDKLLPGDTFEYYFSVNNYDTEENLNELLMQYSIEIETVDSNVLPLEYTIYEIQEDETEVEITKNNSTFELPFCNSENDKSTRNFKIEFTWDAEKNEAETYADKTYTFTVKAVATYSNYTKTAESEKITLTSKPYQKLEVSIEETDETNVYNVTITNNNDYEVKCKISLDNDEFEIECEEMEDGYLTIGANEKQQLQIIISQINRETALYIADGTSNEKKEITVFTQVCSPYNAKNMENVVAVEITKKIITAQDIQADPKTYYGKTVITNGEQGDLEEDYKWVIFYSDGLNIYLIAKDYINNNDAPEKDGIAVTKYGSYCCSFSNIYGCYDGYLGTSAYQHVYDYCWNSAFCEEWQDKTCTYTNMKCVSYMLDHKIWEDKFSCQFQDDSVEYIIGGPTIEQFLEAYNDFHKDTTGEEYEYTVESGSYGYKLKLSTEVTYSQIASILCSDTGHCNFLVVNSTNRAYGMWLSSPSSYNTKYLLIVWSTNRSITGATYTISQYGMRPLVSLKSEVALEEK